MTPDLVRQRITFARKRMLQLFALNGGDLAGASIDDRQQLLIEFFTHLVGAIDMLAQTVNQKRALRIDVEDVHVTKVSELLPAGDPIKAKLVAMYKNTRKDTFPLDPYSDEGYIYRIYNYRHQVAHRAINPFLFSIGPDFEKNRSANIYLDPRDSRRGSSSNTIQKEMETMLQIIEQGCEDILSLI